MAHELTKVDGVWGWRNVVGADTGEPFSVNKLGIASISCTDAGTGAGINAGTVDIEASIDGVNWFNLKTHPGGNSYMYEAAEWIPASAVIHEFRADRPGQHRGIPEITPALPLFAQLRRYTAAVLDAAEMAANISGVIYTDSPPNGEADAVDPLDEVEFERNTFTTMPGGWKIGQVKSEQPTSTYVDFKHEILNEIARCLNMPYNIAACNSSGYNYASGRLDHQTYYKSIRVDQSHIAQNTLDRIFRAWVFEYALASGNTQLLSQSINHAWFWDGMRHVDPLKEANAQRVRLETGMTTYSREYADNGEDWQTAFKQRKAEQDYARQIGYILPGAIGEIADDDDE